MRRGVFTFALLFSLAHTAAAQQAKPDTAKKEAPPIADNSFLIEEAYNQEYGVVQHINTFQRTREGDWAYSFTQEWPAPRERHQLSYSIPVYHLNGAGTGIGDVALNYRFQLLGKDEEPLWFAPRLSLLLPTGDAKAGRGAGGPGVELFFPVSYAINDAIVTHWNAGGSIINGENASGVKETTRNVRGGASAIWLVAPTFNLMFEAVAGRFESVGPTGRRESENSVVISPGARFAFNFASGLQIVPGIAFPIGVGPSSGQRDVFLYLSFEHPFRREH
jgi:hypothetical protein